MQKKTGMCHRVDGWRGVNGLCRVVKMKYKFEVPETQTSGGAGELGDVPLGWEEIGTV